MKSGSTVRTEPEKEFCMDSLTLKPLTKFPHLLLAFGLLLGQGALAYERPIKPIVEQPPDSRFTLDWDVHADSLQARLFSALANLGPAGGVQRAKRNRYLIQDRDNRLMCESATEGFTQVMSYRCDVALSSDYLDWTSEKNAIQRILFEALEGLRTGAGDRIETLEMRDLGTSILIRLVAPDSASKVVCQKKPTAGGPPSYRCLVDLKP
jgi:hypothetical protein